MDLKITILKIEKYCSFSERCKSEIVKKLYDWKIYNNHNEIINHLVDNNYINEERYALLYCMGKFKSRKWGKVKISNYLKNKGIKDEFILSAIKKITDKEYHKSLYQLISRKSKQLKEENIFKKNSKIAKYLYQKGYESDLIWNKIQIIAKTND